MLILAVISLIVSFINLIFLIAISRLLVSKDEREKNKEEEERLKELNSKSLIDLATSSIAYDRPVGTLDKGF